MKQVNDYYAKLARSEGYPARSIYKLKEIQEKHKIIKKNIKILDLGAAPGSWSQYVLNIQKGNGFLLAVDLKDITLKSPYLNQFHALQGSFNNEDILQQIKKRSPYQLILSDAAPSTSGDRFVDACKSAELARRVLSIALAHLQAEGTLIIKIFQGGDEQEIFAALKTHFKRVKAFKPKASRDESAEIFYIGFQFIS